MKALFTILICLVISFSCTQSPKMTKEDRAKIIADSILKAKNDSILKFKQDSISKVIEARKAYERRPWKIGEFVDKFGDPSGRKFIKTITTGSFSNSAATNEFLSVDLTITTRNAGLFLHEYSPDRQAEKFIGDGNVLMKNESGDKIEIKTDGDWNQQGGILISSGYNKLLNFLKKSSGTVAVIVYDEYSSKYSFSIKMDGFNDEFKLLSQK